MEFWFSAYSPVFVNTLNSLMFAGINVCVFETKPCLRGLIFAVAWVLLVV